MPSIDKNHQNLFNEIVSSINELPPGEQLSFLKEMKELLKESNDATREYIKDLKALESDAG